MSGKVIKIQLDENFSLGLEQHNFMLIQHQRTGEINPKTGEEMVTRQNRYYPKIEMALEKYTQESLKYCEDLEAIFWQLGEVEKVMKELIQKFEKNEKSK